MKKKRSMQGQLPCSCLILLKMKLTIFLLLVTFWGSWAVETYSQTTRLTVKMEKSTIEDVLLNIENQSEYRFFYNGIIDVDKQVSVNCENKLIMDVLNEIFEGTGIQYKIFGRQITLSSNVPGLDSMQQPQNISGKVTDSSGTPLPGVTVVVKGTTHGIITDADGNYSLPDVPGDAMLVFSFVGMKTREIAVAGKITIDVVMQEETVGIEEVVAIGYGTQSKLTVTGSVATTKGEEILKNQSPNVVNSITGHLAGVIINDRTGEPGRDDPTIYIRGRSTTGDTDPLIIIDGIARDGLGRINPNDIESISVLKDASAAIYGARAANGVILVTTKQGKEGKPTFDFSYNQGFSQPTRNPDMADSYTFAKIYNEIEISEGSGSAKYSEDELQKYKDGTDPDYPNTDWYDFITKTLTPQHRTNLSVTGGSENIKYYLSVGELHQDGQFNYGTRDFKQYNFRSNVQVKVTDYLKVGLDIAGRYEKKHYPYQKASNLYSHIFLYHPTWTAYWPGTKYLQPLRDNENIINWVSDNAGTNNQKYKCIETTLNFNLDIPWIKGLSIQGSANYDAGYEFDKIFRLPTYVYYYDEDTDTYSEARAGSGVDLAQLTETFEQTSTLTLNSKITFSRSFGKHNTSFMIGYEQMKYHYDYLYGYRSDFVSTAISELSAGSSNKDNQANDGTSSETARQNYFGRATYDYDRKYMAQLIFRYDGSSNFASNKRWGFFPGISLGWRVSEEAFMSNLNFINNLKIRCSYGEMGNDKVDAFQYFTLYGYDSNYVIGNSDVIGLVQSNVPNADITWETAKTTNMGFESTLWNGFLGIELDIFKTRRSDILTTRNVVVPDYTGLSLPDENIGIVENKGFEMQLSHSNNFHELKYSFNGNFSFTRNKVIYADEEPASEKYQEATGRPIGSALYYQAIGIFSSQEDVDSQPHMSGAQPGDIIYKDMNDDGDINSYDMVRNNQTTIPEIVYSLSTNFAYKGFDLSILLQGQENANMNFTTYFRVLSPYSLGNFSKWRANNHWSTDNTNATMPRAHMDLWNNNSNYNSTQWLINAGFLRLKNVEIGYNLSTEACNKLGIGKLRFYIGGTNLMILYDHMKDIGIDPETTAYWYYPQQRTFNVGLNLTF